ncbi:unnamed protein product (mitochondrion) [Plasmodiophora brassicae]|uniref:glutathione transferase n=1 Tax=Plasmodiophora brassicae TaxID=37360 RepID=A0A3P3YGB3_PLABS|nr:unnamed protein product [Plasmodiophora brassicae]
MTGDAQRVVLGYWAIRGLAQPIRMLLKYTKTPFDDVKETLQLDFPNLPYLIDGDLRMTQSMAIILYLAEKHGLAGDTPKARAMINMVANEIADARGKYTGLCYNPQFHHLKDALIENIPNILKRFETFLKHDWICGPSITYADFLCYEMLQQYSTLNNQCLKRFPRLSAYCQRFESLDEIRKCMSEPDFIRTAFNNKIAQFGSG